MLFIRRQSALPNLLAVIVPLLCFVSIAIAIFSNDFSLPWDVTILKRIHATQYIELDAIAIALTQLGRSRVIIAIAFLISVLLVWRKNWQGARYLLLTVVSSGFVNLLAKPLFHRDRPSLWQSPISEFSFSFPSGHAMFLLFSVVFWNIVVTLLLVSKSFGTVG
jgi:undecaprenyl-diphosphatase